MTAGLSGLLLLVFAAAALWYLMPSNGKIHSWVTKPYLETAMPLAIVAGFAIGFVLITRAIWTMLLGSE